MNKKPMTYLDYVKNLQEKKEALPFHKMSDVSRRQFIQSVGVFLGALSVPAFIRMETMSKLSRKILGGSLAYAQGLSNVLDINFYLRAGFNTRWIVGYATDDQPLAGDANVPWTTGVVSVPTRTSGQPVILGPNLATALTPYARAIQSVVGMNQSGHTEYFQSTYRAGMGEMLAWRAASEKEAGGTTLLPGAFFFGNNNDVKVNELPSTLVEFTPTEFGNVADAAAIFTPPVFITKEGTTVSSSIQNKLLTAINSKFGDDVLAGVLQKDVDKITASSNQALTILKNGYANELNPDFGGNSAKMTALRAGLGSQGRLSVRGMDPAEAMFVIIQAASLGITPMVGALGGTTGDWHDINDLLGDPTTDQRYITGTYLGQLAANVAGAAAAGMWTTPSGDPLEIRIHFISEFTRTLSTNMGNDNGDGGTNTTLTIGSNVNQTDYRPGSFGGAQAGTNSPLGYNPSSNTQTGSSFFTPDETLGHIANLLKVNKSLVGLSSFPGISGMA